MGVEVNYENMKALEEAYERMREERDRLREAMQRLARLGNEPHYGNSDGNRIAQAALGIEVGVDA